VISNNREVSSIRQMLVTYSFQIRERIKSFISCLKQNISTSHTSVDISASANLEVVDKFCYLGDMLSVDGDVDAAVEARIRIGWNKFRQLIQLLTNIGIYH